MTAPPGLPGNSGASDTDQSVRRPLPKQAVEADRWSDSVTSKSALLIIFRFFDLGLNAASTVLVARLLGPFEFGRLGFATAAAMFVSSLTDFGLTRSYVHQVAYGHALPSAISSYLLIRLPLLLVTGLLTVTLAVLVPDILSLGPNGADIVIIMLLFWSLRTVAAIGQATLEAQRRVVASQVMVFSVTLPYATSTFAAAYLTHSAEAVALASIVAGLIGAATALGYLSHLGFGRPSREIVGRYATFSGPLLAGSIIGSIAELLDKSLLQMSAGPIPVGYFTAAQRLAAPVVALWSAIGNFLLSSVVRGRRSVETLQQVAESMREADAISTLLLTLLTVPLLLESDTLVRLVFGAAYIDAAPAVAMLSLRTWADAANQTNAALVLGADRTRAYGGISAVLSGLLVALVVISVPPNGFFAFPTLGLGISGAAGSAAIVGMLGLMATEVLVARVYHVGPRLEAVAMLAAATATTWCARVSMGPTAPEAVRWIAEGAVLVVSLAAAQWLRYGRSR